VAESQANGSSADVGAPAGRKKFLVDALQLALRSSEVVRVIDSGTLEYYLDATYTDMVTDTTVDLGPLWSVLEGEPGIEAPMAFPALLAFKSWERRLGVQVKLPPAVDALAPEQRDELQRRCSIDASRLDALLLQRKIANQLPLRAAQQVAVPQPSPSRRPPTWALALAAALGLLIGIGCYLAVRGGRGERARGAFHEPGR
jgi:hypothetical protein